MLSILGFFFLLICFLAGYGLICFYTEFKFWLKQFLKDIHKEKVIFFNNNKIKEDKINE